MGGKVKKNMSFNSEFLNKLRGERKTYRAMVDFCADSMIMNNWIVPELQKQDIYFENYSGDDSEYLDGNGDYITREEFEELEENGEECEQRYADIYQYYIISGADAQRFADYTNEIIIYNDKLDLYILCVTNFGTSWDGVPANWKEPEDEENEE